MKDYQSHNQESFRTAADKAHDIISKKIVNGELEPGCKLSRRKMADLTGVSVIPVIEALKRLEEEGLVESKPQWGSFVIVPTLEKIKEMYVMREAIECQVARILAKGMNSAQNQELLSLAGELDNFEYSRDSYEEINKIHYELHSKMAEFTGYKSLLSSLRRINLLWILCTAVTTRRESRPIAPKWHTQLIETILAGDPDKAEAMMRIHIEDSFGPVSNKINAESKTLSGAE